MKMKKIKQWHLQMRRIRMNGEKILYCNKCGKKIEGDHGMIREGVFTTAYEWGYFSGKDGERHSFCLCEPCYDKIRESFVIPVKTEEYML